VKMVMTQQTTRVLRGRSSQSFIARPRSG
jgi:hypothetical protein